MASLLKGRITRGCWQGVGVTWGGGGSRRPGAVPPHRPPHRHLETNTTSEVEGGVRWRFPASDRVLSMIAMNQNHIYNYGVRVAVNSTRPLHPDHFRQVLATAARKMEVLRLCFRERAGQLWVAERLQPRLSFKVVDENDMNDEMTDLIKEPFDLEDGPLWHARLMPAPADDPCEAKEVPHTHPHRSHLLLTFHHAAADSLMSVTILAVIFQLLEVMAAGAPLDDSPFGEVISDEFTDKIEQEIQTALEQDPARLEALRQEYLQERTPLLVETFGTPEEEGPPQEISRPPVALDEKVMLRLHNESRARGLTLNSTLMGVTNAALVDLVREAGVEREQYVITSRHPVSILRYHTLPKGNYHGYFSSGMNMRMVTPHDIKDNIWKYAHEFQTQFQKGLARNQSCEERVVEALSRPPGYSYDDHFSRPQPLVYDHHFNNIYSGKKIMFGIGRNIQLTEYTNHALHTKNPNGFLFGFGGFRGQVYCQAAHSSAIISPNVIQRFEENVVSILHDVYDALD